MTEANSGDHYFSREPASAGELREITVRLAGAERRLVTAGGVFSPAHLDDGTQVLLDAVPEPPAAGTFLDIGCGWGPIALTMAVESPGAVVWAVDVNERALELTRLNAERMGAGNVRVARPEDVPAEVQFDLIWSNPPIRIGKAELHALMHTWLPRVAVGGEVWMVVQKNLGADSLQQWVAAEFPGCQIERVAVGKGFRVLRYRPAA